MEPLNARIPFYLTPGEHPHPGELYLSIQQTADQPDEGVLMLCDTPSLLEQMLTVTPSLYLRRSAALHQHVLLGLLYYRIHVKDRERLYGVIFDPLRCPVLPQLAIQPTVSTLFLDPAGTIWDLIQTDNVLKSYAQRTLHHAQTLPAWSADAFHTAVADFLGRYPSLEAFWTHFDTSATKAIELPSHDLLSAQVRKRRESGQAQTPRSATLADDTNNP